MASLDSSPYKEKNPERFRKNEKSLPTDLTRAGPGIAGSPTVEELFSELRNSPKQLAFIGFVAKAVFRFFIAIISFLIAALRYFPFEHAVFRPFT